MAATVASANTAFAQLMVDLGPDRVIQTARELGVSAPFPVPVPSVVLGAGEVSVLDMAAAYSTFANQGMRITPRVITRVERADGTLVEELTSDTQQVLTPEQAARITATLEEVIRSGTGREADLGRPAAGKTGTTTQNMDAWFVGYTPQITAAVWMGHILPKEMTSVHGQTVQGGNLPARIWRRFMELATADMEPLAFRPPADMAAGRPLYEELGIVSVPPPGTGGGTATPPPATDPGAEPDPGTDGGTTSSLPPLDLTGDRTDPPSAPDPDPDPPDPPSGGGSPDPAAGG